MDCHYRECMAWIPLKPGQTAGICSANVGNCPRIAALEAEVKTRGGTIAGERRFSDALSKSQQKRIAELESELGKVIGMQQRESEDKDWYKARAEKAEAERDALRKALEFYADEKNREWVLGDNPDEDGWRETDFGKHARAALAQGLGG